MEHQSIKISIVLNADTRPEKNSQDGLFNGVVNRDFLCDSTVNKINFFKDFPNKEVILFVDKHEDIPEKDLEYLYKICDVLVIRKHTHENSFNDYNYLSALSLARGEYIAHFDQDTAAFTRGKESILYMIDLLEQHKFVSYPSYWSPNAVHDPSFGGRMWASTRFFMCKRETLKFDVLRACIEEPEWAYKTFGDVPRRCNWLEHFLTLANDNSVYYPPIQTQNYTIFTWEKYETYTLKRLNEFSYDDIFNWHNTHPIFYPCNCNS